MKPQGCVRTAITHGCVGAVKHRDVRERPLHTDVSVP